MTFRVETTAQAEQDAAEILDWLLSQHAGETGLRWFLALEEEITTLSKFPERCPLAPENPRFPFEVRQLLYGRRPHIYRILFCHRRRNGVRSSYPPRPPQAVAILTWNYAAHVERAKPAAFMTLQTSPGTIRHGFARRLRKGAGADRELQNIAPDRQ